jgi:hypothetical protein
MSDATIWINEPIATEREFDLDLLNQIGTARVSGAAPAAVIKIGYLGGTTMVTDATCTLTEITGGTDVGPYRLRLSPTAVDLVGEVAYEVSTAAAAAWLPTTAYSATNLVINGGLVYTCTVGGTSASSGGPTGTGSGITDGTVTWNFLGTAFATVHGSFQVRALDCLYYGAVTAVGSNSITLDPSNPGGNASGTDGFYANAASGRACVVKVVAGTGAHQSRNGIGYTGSSHVLALDPAEAFTTGLDTTSIVRIEASPTSHTLAMIAGLHHINSMLDGGAGHAQVQYNTRRLATNARLRVFATPAALAAATPGNTDGTDSEIARFIVTGTDVGNGTLAVMTLSQAYP